MPKSLYKKAPQPVAGSRKGAWFSCDLCKAKGEYSLMDIILHKLWCQLAKEEAKQAASARQKRQNAAPSHR